MIKQAELHSNTIHIMFPYDPETVRQVKELAGRKWRPNDREWTCPLCIESVDKLLEWEFKLSPELLEFKFKMGKGKTKLKKLKIDGLKMPLYPFQEQGVSFIEAKDGRCLIGDEMGLGKTAQALAWLQYHPELRPAIIICPASLKLNWEREIKMWMESKFIYVTSGRNPQEANFFKKYTLRLYENFADFIMIINYDIVDSWLDVLKKIDPKVIILDESHYLKNKKAKRTQAVKKLCKKVKHVIALSGTPIINRPIEIFTAINIINSRIFPNWWAFAQRYCGLRHNGFGWDPGGASNTEELHLKLTHSIMIRRLKKDVLPELPEKVRTIVPMELDNNGQYKAAEADLIGWIKENQGKAKAEKAGMAEQIVRFEVLKQLVIKSKLNQCIKWIYDFLESGEKLVVFATHKKVIDKLMLEFYGKGRVKIDGSIRPTRKQQIVEVFQHDKKIKLFIGNIKAAGVGITLTAASSTCFIELGWTPGEHDQAEDRVHRIGQEADSVNAYYLLTKGTIEEDIAELLDKKRKVLKQVLDGEAMQDNESILEGLVKKYEKTYRHN